jgi:hypothetical protein
MPGLVKNHIFTQPVKLMAKDKSDTKGLKAVFGYIPPLALHNMYWEQCYKCHAGNSKITACIIFNNISL